MAEKKFAIKAGLYYNRKRVFAAEELRPVSRPISPGYWLSDCPAAPAFPGGESNAVYVPNEGNLLPSDCD